MKKSAIIGGPGDCYRYELRRIWNAEKPLLVVCMLNPSKADHKADDPTILALIHFGKLWGYGGLIVVNLQAWRASSPDEMMEASDPVGPGNAAHIAKAMEYAAQNGRQLLAAWGNGGGFLDRDEWFCSRAYHVYKLDLICLGTTNSWKPKHSMARGKHRIARDQQPIMWRKSA